MSNEDGAKPLQHQEKLRYVFSALFFLWIGLAVLVGWIVQGGALYVMIASHFPFMGIVRGALLPYFTRPYVF